MLTPATKAYTRRFMVAMSTYIGAVCGVTWVFNSGLVSRTDGLPVLVYAVAALPALPIFAMIWTLWRFLEESDEYIRFLTTKRIVLAAGGLLAFVTLWGFLEIYAKAPDFPLFLCLPLFFGLFGVMSFIVREV